MKARIENNTIRIYGGLPQDFENILNFHSADEATVRSKGFYDVVVPEYDSANWKLGQLYFDQQNSVFTYGLEEMSIEEVAGRLKHDLEQAKNKARRELTEALVDKMIELHRSDLSDDLVRLYDAMKAENERVKATIEDMSINDPDSLRLFRIKSEDVDRFVSEIRKHKL